MELQAVPWDTQTALRNRSRHEHPSGNARGSFREVLEPRPRMEGRRCGVQGGRRGQRRAARLRGASDGLGHVLHRVRGHARRLRHPRARVAPPRHLAVQDDRPLQGPQGRVPDPRRRHRARSLGGRRRQALHGPVRRPGRRHGALRADGERHRRAFR